MFLFLEKYILYFIRTITLCCGDKFLKGPLVEFQKIPSKGSLLDFERTLVGPEKLLYVMKHPEGLLYLKNAHS